MVQIRSIHKMHANKDVRLVYTPESNGYTLLIYQEVFKDQDRLYKVLTDAIIKLKNRGIEYLPSLTERGIG